MRGQHRSVSSSARHRANIKQNETVAIVGGDSDLVLMGLVVPPSVTHNIHVILPDFRKSIVISVWETSRMMARLIEGAAKYGAKAAKKEDGKKRKHSLTLRQMDQTRIDTALLVIMNGNDYLPKLRGCRGGFDPVFKVYLDLLATAWPQETHGGGVPPFLIDVDERDALYLNVPFALAFFRALPFDGQVLDADAEAGDSGAAPWRPELGVLHNLVEAKILPGPMTFSTLPPRESVLARELRATDSSKRNAACVVDEVFAAGAEVVRLTLGPFPDAIEALTANKAADATIENVRCSQEITTVLEDSADHGVVSKMTERRNNTDTASRAYLFEVPHREQYG